ncbi:hypothetical protein ABZX51_000508 [Aspergillus tubingensis]
MLINQILEGIEKIGKRLGVEYRLNSPVSSIIISEDQSARGVILSSGEKLEADLVVVNADLVYAYNNLLPASKEARHLSNREASCSSISFFWSFDRVISELKVHNIFLAEEYKISFDSIFKDHQLPDEPSFYVNVPSRIDPTAAPKGKDAVVTGIHSSAKQGTLYLIQSKHELELEHFEKAYSTSPSRHRQAGKKSSTSIEALS